MSGMFGGGSSQKPPASQGLRFDTVLKGLKHTTTLFAERKGRNTALLHMQWQADLVNRLKRHRLKNPKTLGRMSEEEVKEAVREFDRATQPEADADDKEEIARRDAEMEDFLQGLRQNPRIAYDESVKSYRFRPAYEVVDKNGLMDALMENRNKKWPLFFNNHRRHVNRQEHCLGVPLETRENISGLEDSYELVKRDVEKLEEDGKVYVFKQKHGSRKHIIHIHGDPSTRRKVNEEIKTLWSRVHVPAKEEYYAQLESGRLPMIRLKFAPMAGGDEKKKKYKASIKQTNTHVDLDQFSGTVKMQKLG
eukprot:Clim_evm36s136 gene=Clim_evmTU36s136